MTRSRDRTPPKLRETAGSRLFRRRAHQRSKTRAVWIAAGAAVIMTVILPFWVAPWVPVGMTEDDFSPSVWVALALATGGAVMALIALLAAQPIAGQDGLVEAWHSLLGKPMMVRNRRQFQNRLARECKLCQRDRRQALSLLLVRLQRGDEPKTQDGPDPLSYVVDILVATMRHSDVIGIAGDDEIGVLAIAADAKGREVVRARFERTLAAACANWTGSGAFGRVPGVSLGATTYDPDDVPDSLVAAARQALTPVRIRTTRAA